MSYTRVKESDIAIGGNCIKEFEPVRRRFYENFVQGKESNAQVCIYLGKQCVVDLWGSSKSDKSYGPDSFHVCTFTFSIKTTFFLLKFFHVNFLYILLMNF